MQRAVADRPVGAERSALSPIAQSALDAAGCRPYRHLRALAKIGDPPAPDCLDCRSADTMTAAQSQMISPWKDPEMGEVSAATSHIANSAPSATRHERIAGGARRLNIALPTPPNRTASHSTSPTRPRSVAIER